MQNKLSKIISLALLSITLVVAGCKSTPQTVAFKSLSAIATSVQVATQAYWNFRDSNPGRVPNDLDDKLKKAYAEYQQAFALASIAERIAASSGSPPDASTMAAVTQAAANFTALVSAANPAFKP